MTFLSCCVIDDIHCCKSTVLSDFGTGLGLWTLFALLCTDLVAKTGEIPSGPGLSDRMPKQAGLCEHTKPRGGLTGHAWAMCCLLLMTARGLGILFRHALGHFMAPCLDLVLSWVHAGKRHSQKGVCTEKVVSSIPSLFAYGYSNLHQQLSQVVGDPKRQHRGWQRSFWRERGLCLTQRLGDSWSSRAKMAQDWDLGHHQAHVREWAVQLRSTSLTPLLQAWLQAKASPTSGEENLVPSAPCQTRVALQAPKDLNSESTACRGSCKWNSWGCWGTVAAALVSLPNMKVEL